MKVVAVFALCLAFAAALPVPEEHNEQNVSSARPKRFIFFSFAPYPVVASPVVVAQSAPVVTKTKVVAAQPVTYTYQYTIPQYSYSVVKAAPVVVAAAAPAVTVTKTASVATEVSSDDSE